ncbi:MAG: type I-E CRISPR-associated protein Cse1/CasA, partial [Candidatus Competibacteraceae bacterium]|nr:type I-E CRISPR-associated protein Cse1/CasA [Candidatus Competibacteraceae bacterium]
MNLITDPWIPIRRRDGGFGLIAPHQITDPDDPPLTLDAPRADFDGALMQFLIGLLQTVCPPERDREWRRMLAEPPTPDELWSRFK